MSFINSFKRAFGFPGEYDRDDEELESELNDDELEDDPDPTLEEYPAADILMDTPALEPVPLTDPKAVRKLADGLFDAVLAYFNSHQPELVQKCIDIEAQRAMIIENMEKDIVDRMTAMADAACRRGEHKWAEKQQQLGAELMKLKSEYNAVRQQQEDSQSIQLSATRQKRAFTDRIRDLENQVTQLVADREQLQLENKSMASRLRADTPGTAGKDTASAEETEKLRNENESLRKELSDQQNSARQLSQELEQLKKQMSAGETTGLSVEVLTEELREMEKSLTPLREMKDAAEAKVISLTQEIKQSDATIASLQRRLVESAQATELASRETEQLRSTIENNLYLHAEAEAELRERIKALEKEIASLSPKPESTAENAGEDKKTETNLPPVPQVAKKRKKKRKSKPTFGVTLAGMEDVEPASEQSVRISAIDELMDSTDWFVAPDPIPLKKDPEVEEIFGYKEPQKKNETPDDDRQLTLW